MAKILLDLKVATIMGVQENPFFNIDILDVFLQSCNKILKTLGRHIYGLDLKVESECYSIECIMDI